MRSLRNVAVKEAIVHILEEDEGRKVISERPVPLKDNPNISVYFEDLITKASEDGSARAAVFSDIEPNEPYDLCSKMFNGPAEFTTGSKAFSEKFYALMEGDHRIGDGDLVACRFTADSDSGRDFLAVMKLIPVGAYRNVQRGRAGSGEMYIDLEIDPFVFPKNIDVLQKVAFISKPPSKDRAPEVLILDKQYKRGEIALFFKNFLDVALVRDDAELTLNLYRCLVLCLNNVRETLTPQLDRYLGERIYEIFTEDYIEKLARHGTLDMYGWVEDLKMNRGLKDRFTEDIKGEFGRTKNLKLDLSLVGKYIKKRSFNAQGNSKFNAETSNYNDLVQSVRFVTNKPSVAPYFEVVIHTSTWREDVN